MDRKFNPADYQGSFESAYAKALKFAHDINRAKYDVSIHADPESQYVTVITWTRKKA